MTGVMVVAKQGTRATTIDDIAKKANVSKATVSKVINGYSGINEKTRQAVLKVMREYNYWPNTTARSLSMQQSYLVGLFMASELNNSFFREVIPGIEKTLGAQGYDILYFADKRPGNTGVSFGYLEKCRDRRVDGAIFLSYIRDELAEFEPILASDIPTVFVDMTLEGPLTSYVISDNYKSAKLAVEYLHSLGHRKIGYADGGTKSVPAEKRYQGLMDTVRDMGMECRPEWIFQYSFDEEYGYDVVNKLQQLDEWPTAVVAQDNVAIGMIRALREIGKSVPDDLSIVGFDDIEISSHYNLTTVRQQKYEMGVAASKLLMKIILNHKASKPKLMDTELIIRGSCKPIT